MRKITKIFTLLIGLFISLVIILFLGAFIFLNPNHYKDSIAVKASQQLGHTVVIGGELSAKYFPWLGLTAKNVSIISSSAPEGQPLANIESLSFKVETWPLLKKQIKLDTILIEKAKIHLERKANGKANWDPLNTKATSRSKSIDASKADPASSTDSAPSEQTNLVFEISGIQISDSNVSYVDQSSQQHFDFQELNLKTSAITPGESTPISGDFKMKASQQEQAMQNTTSFSGVLNFTQYDPVEFTIKSINVDSEINSQTLRKSPLKLKLQGDLSTSLKQATLHFKNGVIDVDQSHGTGHASFSWKQSKLLEFDLDVDKINADHYIQLASASTTTSPTYVADNSTHQNSFIHHAAYNPAGRLHYKGNLNIKTLMAQGLTLHQVALTIKDTSSGFNINPLKAQLYDGSFQGQTNVNLSSHALEVKGNLSQINLESLLKALKQKPSITGTGNVQMDLKIDAKGLNGTTQFKLNNGIIRGVDLDYYLKYARAVLKKLPVPTDDRKETDYDTITGTLLAKNHVLHNNDLKLNANDFHASGDGSIDLNKKYLDYDFIAHRIYHDGAEHPDALPLIVKIRGPFDNLKITPDMDAYIKTILKKEAQGVIEKELNKQAEKIFGRESNEEGSSSKIEEEIEKSLKKLFKF